MKAGDTIPVIGPLGNGFPFEKAEGKKVFLMGGGIGVPPILVNVRSKSRKPADKRQAFHTGTQKGEQEKEILKKLFFRSCKLH